jgi:hypothetical protein
MTEAAPGLTISGCISREVGITLSPMVMRKFQDTCRSKSGPPCCDGGEHMTYLHD